MKKTPAIRKALDLLADKIGDDHEVVMDAQAERLALKIEMQDRVAQFHRACGLPVASEPTVGTPEQRELRVRLMLEEVLEFAKAAGVSIELNSFRIKGTAELKLWISHHANLVEMTHELADVQYVTSGTAVELGLPLPEAFSEVHGANMRKVGPDGKVVMVNGKVCKPEGWKPADVAHLLEK